MSKYTVLVTGKTISQEAQQPLHDDGAEILYMPISIEEPALLEAFARQPIQAVILRGPAPFTPKVFDAAKHLKIISKLGIGIDSVDLASANAHKVAVMVATGANADAVAELSLSLMLALVRELPRFDRDLRQGIWKDQGLKLRDFRGRIVGIVGYGAIGKRTAQIAAACGAKIVIHSRTRVEAPAGMAWEGDFNRLLEHVDILSLHCPLTDDTRNMLGEKQFARMKRGALLINTARGKLIDEPALIAALQSGQLAGAGLDVFTKEPPDKDNPLFTLPNVICTPHIASTTDGANAQAGAVAAQNIVHYLRGEIYDHVHWVNPQAFNQ